MGWTSLTSNPALSRVRPPGPRAETLLLWVTSDKGLFWSINWDNWLEPKNSFIAAVTGFAFIRSDGPKPSVSATFNLSLTALSTLKSPTLTWLATISPTDLILLFPKWSISSQFCFPFLISTSVFITSKISSLHKIPSPDNSSLANLLLNFILPTPERSYFSGLKNKFSNKRVAASLVGGSPGRIIL